MLAGRIARKVLSKRWIRTLWQPRLLPDYYLAIAGDIEVILDLDERPEWKDDEYWAALLRKYAHIMDKGLLACEFEQGRGQLYRNAAAEALAHIRSDSFRNDPSVQWASGKIEQYDNAQKQAAAFHGVSPLNSPLCSYENFAAFARSRRSIRSFQHKTITDETIRKIVELAPWGPSSCNKQTVKVFASNSPELARQCLATCKGGTCFSDFIPSFFSFCSDLRSYILPQEAWLPQIDVSLGAQNCCLAASALGLSITLLSWCQSDKQDDRRLRQLLGISPFYRIIFNAVAGYPATSVEVPGRKSVDNTLIIRKTPVN